MRSLQRFLTNLTVFRSNWNLPIFFLPLYFFFNTCIIIYNARNRNTIFLYEREANKFFEVFVFDELDGLPIQLELVYIFFSSTPVDWTMTYGARNKKITLICGREANKFQYFHNFQTKATSTFAHSSKNLFFLHKI